MKGKNSVTAFMEIIILDANVQSLGSSCEVIEVVEVLLGSLKICTTLKTCFLDILIRCLNYAKSVLLFGEFKFLSYDVDGRCVSNLDNVIWSLPICNSFTLYYGLLSYWPKYDDELVEVFYGPLGSVSEYWT